MPETDEDIRSMEPTCRTEGALNPWRSPREKVGSGRARHTTRHDPIAANGCTSRESRVCEAIRHFGRRHVLSALAPSGGRASTDAPESALISGMGGSYDDRWVDNTLAPYESLVDAYVLIDMRALLRALLASHPVGAQLSGELRHRAPEASSGVVSGDAPEDAVAAERKRR